MAKTIQKGDLIMVAVSIILGIVCIIGGIYCMVAPINTYYSVMMLFAAMLLVYGVYGIVRFFKRKALVPEFIISIVSVIIGFVYLFRPGNTGSSGVMGLDRIVLFLTAAWFLIKGCITVYYSVKTRFFNNHWVLQFFSGLLSVILGIYSFMYPSTAATSIGILVGMWEIQCGIDFLTLGTMVGFVQERINQVEAEINRHVDETMKAVEKIQKDAEAAVAAEQAKVKAAAAEPGKAVSEEPAITVEAKPVDDAADVKTDK